MGARIELVKGNMFDGSSDLVVIPCSTRPSITRFVAEHLSSFGIPGPQKPMELGEVVFLDLKRASNVAQVAAMAASVRRGGSSPDAIRGIGAALGSYAALNPWISQISCPLLGARAGHLAPAEAGRSLAAGFLASAPDQATLRIFVLEDAVFRRLRSVLAAEADSEVPEQIQAVEVSARPLRVFISYAKSSAEHQSWVKEIAAYLRSAGVDVRLDVWHLRPGMDVAQWMCNELDMADRVLLVCDELYADKADRRHGGVGWEIRVIQGVLLQSQATNPDRFVPVVVTEDAAQGMPAFLRAVYCVHWPASQRDDRSRYDELVQVIYRAQEEAPPIGMPPSYVLTRR
jgi:hypothetical protein